jgi:hypothetical protein
MTLSNAVGSESQVPCSLWPLVALLNLLLALLVCSGCGQATARQSAPDHASTVIQVADEQRAAVVTEQTHVEPAIEQSTTAPLLFADERIEPYQPRGPPGLVVLPFFPAPLILPADLNMPGELGVVVERVVRGQHVIAWAAISPVGWRVGAVRTVGFRYYNPVIGRYISRDPLGYKDGMNPYTYVHNNPINHIDPLGLWTWGGVFRTVGGALETTVGGSIAVAAGWTGVGAVVGVAIAAHGLDTMQAGIRQTFSDDGKHVDSLTSSGLQAAGVPRTAANITDAGISIAGSLGGGLVNAASKVAAVAATPEAAGLTTVQILTKIEQGSKALPTATFEALGGTATSAITKADMIASGTVAGTEGLNIGTAVTLAPTGLTPLADVGAGALSATATGAGAAVEAAQEGPKPAPQPTPEKPADPKEK